MTLFQVFKAFWLRLVSLFHTAEAEVVAEEQKVVAELRKCESCLEHAELWVSREIGGTLCHKCAGLK